MVASATARCAAEAMAAAAESARLALASHCPVAAAAAGMPAGKRMGLNVLVVFGLGRPDRVPTGTTLATVQYAHSLRQGLLQEADFVLYGGHAAERNRRLIGRQADDPCVFGQC